MPDARDMHGLSFWIIIEESYITGHSLETCPTAAHSAVPVSFPRFVYSWRLL